MQVGDQAEAEEREGPGERKDGVVHLQRLG